MPMHAPPFYILNTPFFLHFTKNTIIYLKKLQKHTKSERKINTQLINWLIFIYFELSTGGLEKHIFS